MLHYVFVSRLAARNRSLPVVTTEPPFPSTWQRGESLPSLPTRRSELQWCPWRAPMRPMFQRDRLADAETVQGFAPSPQPRPSPQTRALWFGKGKRNNRLFVTEGVSSSWFAVSIVGSVGSKARVPLVSLPTRNGLPHRPGPSATFYTSLMYKDS